MTRKDYKRIAYAISTLPLKARSKKQLNEMRQAIALHMANALKGTNPRYDSSRFYRACLAE